MGCRTGCKTQDHESWGDCLRASNLQMNTGDAKAGVMPNKKFVAELDLYKEARKQGVQPAGTSTDKIRAALDASEKLGKAYNAETMPNAKVITKQAAAAMNEVGM